MKTVFKKLLSVMLVALLLVSAVPFASATEAETVDITIYEAVDGDPSNMKEVETVKDVNVESYASLDDMVNDIYDGYWKTYRYRDFQDGTAMLQITPLETVDEKEVVTIKLYRNNVTSEYETMDVYVGDNLLDAIKANGISFTYEGHTFVGWSTKMTGGEDTLINYYTTATGDMNLYADWEKITDDDDAEDEVVYDAVLKIFTNGKTSSAAKTVKLDTYSLDGKITRDEVQKVVAKYFSAADNDGLTYYGLFTTETWNKGNYDTDDAAYSVDLTADEPTYIYVMVKNVKNVVADNTNPKTGDVIAIALGTMMSSAAGAAYLFLNKKNIVK